VTNRKSPGPARGSKVVVVTDSTADLPPELISELDIAVVPLHVRYADGREILDSEVDLEAYYRELAEIVSSGGELPTTSPATREQFAAAYEPLLADGRDVVSIHISSGLSETCGAAREAAARLEEDGGPARVKVIDSATAAGHLGVLALVAARKSASGADIVDVVARVREARPETKMRFAARTLEYLKHGGRIGGAAAWLGTTLDIKPILEIGSEITAVERVRSWDRVLERMVEYGRQLHEAGAEAWYVQHAANATDAELLVERLQEVFWRQPEFVTELGPIIGTHVGPGLVGVGGVPPRFLE
jgi:DegV family protein with EDD domain